MLRGGVIVMISAYTLGASYTVESKSMLAYFRGHGCHNRIHSVAYMSE